MAAFDSSSSPKIADLIAARTSPFVSVEFFPPKTQAGLDSLDKVIEKLKHLDPLFTDFTWGAGGSTSELTVDLCVKAKEQFGLNPNMHLTCTNMEVEKIHSALAKCKEAGITNILALRGDPPLGQERWTATDGGFSCALDLIGYIKRDYGDYFSISCAGYPEGHPDNMTKVNSIDELSTEEKHRYNVEETETGEQIIHVCRDDAFQREMEYLKQKVDAGATLIVTQMVFDPECFGAFVRKCREIGITVPILPGIMCITSYGGFKRMTKFCKSRVPEAMGPRFEAIKDDEAAVKELGIDIGYEISKRILEIGAPGIHYYTLNLANTTVAIVNRLRSEGVLPPTLADIQAAVVAEAVASQAVSATAFS